MNKKPEQNSSQMSLWLLDTSKHRELNGKSTGTKRNFNDLSQNSKITHNCAAERSRQPSNSPSRHLTASRSKNLIETSKKQKDQGKLAEFKESVQYGLDLGAKKVEITPLFLWDNVSKEKILQLKINDKGIFLYDGEKIAALIKSVMFPGFEALHKTQTIGVRAKKLDSRYTMMSCFLNQNYGLEGQIETAADAWRLSRPYEVVEAFRSLFLFLGHSKTTSSPKDPNCKYAAPKKSDTSHSSSPNIKKPEKASVVSNILEDPKEEDSNDHHSKTFENLQHPNLDVLTSKLRNYQINGLDWMLKGEGKQLEGQKGKLYQEMLHSEFEEWTMANDSKIYLNILDAQVLMEFPKQERMGGILADDMSLGKTLTTIALILSNPVKADSELSVSGEDNSDFDLPVKKPNIAKKSKKVSLHIRGTLIACPPTLKDYWEAEIRKHTQMNCLKVLCYEEPKHRELTVDMISKYDVVVVSYDSLQASKDCVLHLMHWHRVVLDEPHYIKTCMKFKISEDLQEMKKIVWKLKAKYRWVLARTFTYNKLANEEIMLQFLKAEHLGMSEKNLAEWLAKVRQTPEWVDSILQPLILRRTKESLSAADLGALGLPPKKMEIKSIKLIKDEEKTYLRMKEKAITIFKTLYDNKADNLNVDKRENASILKIINRMRQACNHQILINSNKNFRELLALDFAEKLKSFLEKKGIDVDADERLRALQENEHRVSIKALKEKIDSLKKNEVEGCAICWQEPEATIAFAICGHTYCDECLAEALARDPERRCPECRKVIREEDKLVFGRALLQVDPTKKSSKVDAIMESIVSVAKQREKCVCFTQSTAMVDILIYEMRRTGIKFISMDGNCGSDKTNRLIREFSDDAETTVLVVNSMLNGAWMSLTSANHVLLVEPWWNPRMEEQAIDLVHSSGQTKPVYVTRFVCMGTIEEKIMGLRGENEMKHAPNKSKRQEEYNKYKYLLDI